MKHITRNKKSLKNFCFMFHVPCSIRGGFSLIELLVVMGMMMILLSVGTLSFAGIRIAGHVDLVASEVRSELLRARARTENNVPSGVYFEPDRFVYFEGADYVEGAVGNEETMLPDSLTFSSITFVDSIVIFDHITRNILNYADPSNAVLTDVQSGITKTISVNEWGTIDIQ